MRPLEFGWYLPTHGDTTAYGADRGANSGLSRTVRPRGAGGGRGRLRVSADPGRLGVLGGMDHGRVHGGALVAHQAADCGAARLHQSGAAGEDDLDLRPDVGRAHLHQPDRRPERERSRRRGRALRQGGTLRADGGGSLDPQGAVDHARPGELSKASSTSCRARISGRVRCSSRFQNSISAAARARPGNCRRSIPTCICSGAICRKRSRQYRRDQGDGARAWPRKRHRLRHAAAGDLPRERSGRLGGRRSDWCATPPSGRSRK